MALVTAGWSIMSDAEYAIYCDALGSSTEPTFAVDLDNVDQAVGAGTTKILCTRVLWDKTGAYDVEEAKLRPDRDGVLNANGTVTVRSLVNTARISIEIYRKDEPWFTVAQRDVVGVDIIAMTFSCDIDAYKSEDHDFDLRIRVEPIDALVEASVVVSGSDEETAWGASWVAFLYQKSPTG